MKDTQIKVGNLSALAARQRPADEYISQQERSRVSDEAIVSDDLAGQHNPLASQGPLGWNVQYKCPAIHARKGYRGERLDSGLHISRGRYPAKVAADFQFEAVLGKTRRTEF